MPQSDILPFATPPPAEFGARLVRDVVDWYLKQPGALGTSIVGRRERQRILSIFTTRFGDWPLDRARPVLIQTLINEQPEVHSDWTRKRWWGTIRCPFNQAAKLGLIDRNPFAGPTIPQGDDGRDLTEDEYRAMVRAATPAYRKVLFFMRTSGARPGELKEITAELVDLANRCVVLQKHKTRKKTRRARVIVVDEVGAKFLRHLIRQAKPGAKLFLNSHGGPWKTRALDKNFNHLRQKCGIPTDARLYSVRHSFATQAIVNGCSTATVAELLGHSGLATVQRYVHLANKKAHLAGAVEQALGRKSKK